MFIFNSKKKIKCKKRERQKEWKIHKNDSIKKKEKNNWSVS